MPQRGLQKCRRAPDRSRKCLREGDAAVRYQPAQPSDVGDRHDTNSDAGCRRQRHSPDGLRDAHVSDRYQESLRLPGPRDGEPDKRGSRIGNVEQRLLRANHEGESIRLRREDVLDAALG